MQYKQINLSGVVIKRVDVINDTEKLLCPFCLHEDTIREFNNKGRYYKCPECKNEITRFGLITSFSVKDYALWVFAYIKNRKEKHKLIFEKIKERLYERGLISQFWSEYFKLRDNINVS